MRTGAFTFRDPPAKKISSLMGVFMVTVSLEKAWRPWAPEIRARNIIKHWNKILIQSTDNYRIFLK